MQAQRLRRMSGLSLEHFAAALLTSPGSCTRGGVLHAMPLDPDNEPPPEIMDDIFALGFSESKNGRGLLYDSIKEIVLPRLDAFGLHATEAWKTRKQVV